MIRDRATSCDWVSIEAMLMPSPDMWIVVSACRARRYRRRFVACLRRDDELVMHGDVATTVAEAIDLLRAEYLRRVREGWRP